MSLQPPSSYQVPDHTAHVARTAFPKGTLCLRLYDELGTIFTDHDLWTSLRTGGNRRRPPFGWRW